MKKSQFAPLHAGMLMRSSSAAALRAKRKSEVPAVEPAPAAAASEAAELDAPVWRSDGPMAFESWEHLRAELLPPGWGRSSAAGADAAIVDDDDKRPAPTLVARNDVAGDQDDGEQHQQRQRGGFGRRSTPPPAHDIDGIADADAEIAEALPAPDDVEPEEGVADEPESVAAAETDAELDIPEPADMSAMAFADLDVAATALDYEDIRDEVMAEAAMAAIVPADDDFDAGHDEATFAEVEPDAPIAVDCIGEGDVIEPPAMAAGRRKAMTVRLDLPRHRRLRLAGVYYGRSCQDLMVSALDGYLAHMGFGADSET